MQQLCYTITNLVRTAEEQVGVKEKKTTHFLSEVQFYHLNQDPAGLALKNPPKKPTQKNPPKKNQKNPKKPT